MKCINFDKKYINSLLNNVDYNLTSIQKKFVISSLEDIYKYSYETYIHLLNTYEIAICMSEACNLNNHDKNTLLLAALIHDIGKLKINKNILHSKNILTDIERKIINEHSTFGYEMVSNILPDDVCKIVYHHHETLNGKGYPQGLKEDELSDLDKILSVCDVTSALLLPRSYKEAFKTSKIIEILNECASKKQLDANYVNVVISQYLLKENIKITKEINSNKEAFFITGATGFLGSHIVKILSKRDNVQIFAFVLKNDVNTSNLYKYKNVHVIFGNILNENDVDKFLSTPFKGNKYLIHCAGKITTLKNDDGFVMKVNYDGSKNIVNSIKDKNYKKVVYISSVDSLSKSNEKIITEQERYDPKNVVGIYGKSKCFANNYFLNNLDNCVIILPSALYGPDDPINCPINNAINKMINNKLPAIVKGGYNLVDVRDCAQAIINACYFGNDKNSYILGGYYISIKNLMKQCSAFTKCKEVRFTVPHFLIHLADPFIRLNSKIKHKTPLFTGFSMYCLKQNSNYTHQKAHDDLSFTPRPLFESLDDTIKFLREKNAK